MINRPLSYPLFFSLMCLCSTSDTVNAQKIQNKNMTTTTTTQVAARASVPDLGTQFFTTGDNCRIAYRIDGESGKPVLVLSNSIATDFHMWDAQIRQLSRHFRVIRFDTRGNGASGAPVGDYSVARLGNDVIELLDHLHIPKAHFCGLSLGGYIGQWLGIHAPERINRLVLANTASYLGPREPWDQLIQELRSDGEMSKFADMFMKNWFPEAMLSGTNSTVQTFRNMVLSTSPQGLAGSYAAVRDADMRRTIALIPNKTLVIAGKFDVVTQAVHGESIASTIPGAKLVTLPAVHMSNIEYKEEFEKQLIDFLLEN
jgi:3-oxoadipate enol-lactonase